MPILKEGDQKIKEFWVKWLQANELEQLKLIQTLMLPSNVIRDEKLFKYHCASVLNRYLEDMVKAIASMSTAELELYLTPYEPPES